MKHHHLLALLTIISLSSICPTLASAQTLVPKRVLFINQVRGTECCDTGSAETLQFQLDQFNTNNIPATFTIRYDALIDPDFQYIFQQLAPEQFELGLFLEITPALAAQSGVEYSASSADWYQAQHAYTLGYSLEDRKKIIDTLFETFYDQFGYYPQVTTGWIVDTPTLNYIRLKYGSSIHQITREQWSTDSYTLSGGHVHYPYLAGKNWAFFPTDPSSLQDPLNGCVRTDLRDSTARDEKSLFLPCNELNKNPNHLILRQTVSDPLMNYGDQTSGYTSQPNDYLQADHDIEYFKRLVTQALEQSQNTYAIAILGLENSMPQDIQTAFAQQIKWIANLKESDSSIQTPIVSQFDQEFRTSLYTPITSVQGAQLEDAAEEDTTAYWINTPRYRLRILKKADQLLITDLRIYSPRITDPYMNFIAREHAYWIAPFLLDGSRFYKTVEITEQEKNRTSLSFQILERLRNRWLPERHHQTKHIEPVQSDIHTTPYSFSLPSPKTTPTLSYQKNLNKLSLSYQDKNDQPTTINFYTDQFEVESTPRWSFNRSDFMDDSLEFMEVKKEGNRFIFSWNQLNQESAALALAEDCFEENCFFTPLVSGSVDWPNFYHQYYPYLLPEVIPRAIDPKKTILYAYNPVAISGKNPVRFILVPKDELDYPTQLFNSLDISSEPHIEDFSINAQNSVDGTIYVDAIENRVGKYTVSFSLEENHTYSEDVYIAPNCAKTPFACVRNPKQSWWYIKSIFLSKLRGI